MTQPNQSADATKPVANDEEAMPALPEHAASIHEDGYWLNNKHGPLHTTAHHLTWAKKLVYTAEQVYDAIRKDRAGRGSEAPATLRVVQPQQDYVERGMELSLRCAEAELHEIVQCREALRSHLSMRLQAVPPGWQMVPIEPTVEMRLALARFEDLESPDRAWRAALAAAPTPKD